MRGSPGAQLLNMACSQCSSDEYDTVSATKNGCGLVAGVRWSLYMPPSDLRCAVPRGGVCRRGFNEPAAGRAYRYSLRYDL